MLDAFMATTNGIVPTPTTSLVTGYDFLRDAADQVRSQLEGGISHPGDALLAGNGSGSCSRCLDRQPMKTAVTGSRRPDLHGRPLQRGGGARGRLCHDDDLDRRLELGHELQNSIVFSAGCHAGYNLLDVDSVAGTGSVDWAQAFARKRADADRRDGLPVRRRRAREYGGVSRGARLPASSRLRSRVARQGAHRGRSAHLVLHAGHSRPPREVDPAGDALRAPMLSVDYPAPARPANPEPDDRSGSGVQRRRRHASEPRVGGREPVYPDVPGLAELAPRTYRAGLDGYAVNANAPVLLLQVEDASVTAPSSARRVPGRAFTDTAGITPVTSNVSTLIGSPTQPAHRRRCSCLRRSGRITSTPCRQAAGRPTCS